MSRYTLSLVAACAFAVPALAKPATPDDEVVRIVVPTRDLNLQSEEGQRHLFVRIERAAHQICGEVDAREIIRKAAERRCVQEIVERTITDTRSERLSEAYRHLVGRGAG